MSDRFLSKALITRPGHLDAPASIGPITAERIDLARRVADELRTLVSRRGSDPRSAHALLAIEAAARAWTASGRPADERDEPMLRALVEELDREALEVAPTRLRASIRAARARERLVGVEPRWLPIDTDDMHAAIEAWCAPRGRGRPSSGAPPSRATVVHRLLAKAGVRQDTKTVARALRGLAGPK